jgi:hypothetical protein
MLLPFWYNNNVKAGVDSSPGNLLVSGNVRARRTISLFSYTPFPFGEGKPCLLGEARSVVACESRIIKLFPEEQETHE